MDRWAESLRHDPIPALLASDDEALSYFVRRDLLGQEVGPVHLLWTLPEAAKILAKQQPDGSWKYPSRRQHGFPGEDFAQLETYRQLRVLVEQYGFDRGHPSVERIAVYYFTKQTDEGDIRGIFGPEYAPHYTAWIMELLIKSGYEDEESIERGFQWFRAMRQDDGGWAWPIRTAGVRYQDAVLDPDPTQPDRSKPFSHVLTGAILRSYACHPRHRGAAEARTAAALLKSRFFKPDSYPDRRGGSYWTKFQFPFWWPNILTALDSLTFMGDHDLQVGLDWFVRHQQEDGLWPSGYKDTGTPKSQSARLWVGLAVCRVFERLSI